MRRTITTLMFLAVGGLAFVAQATENTRGNWQYYAAGQSSYKISDEEDADDAPQQSSGVVKAVGQPQASGQEKNALYTAAGGSVGNDIAQTSYFNGGGCNCGQGACGQNTCLSD